MSKIKEYISKNKDRFFNELDKFINFKSISADKCFSEEMKICGNYLISLLQKIGAKTSILETHGINVIYGEICSHQNAPTVLIYGHYDVQPANKEDGWESDPFKLSKKNNKWYARGVSDDKGPVFAIIKAIEALQKTSELKLNFKFIIEGEEESGSKNLKTCIRENKSRLKSDLIFISDTEWLTEENPSIPYGLRGIVYAFIRINGPSIDLHSGTYGGMLKNPHLELARILVQLKDEKERIQIPDFYGKVRQVSNEEKELIKEIPLNIEYLKKELGIELISRDKVDLLIRRSAMPTFEIHGITGGYTGQGGKTIIPSYAEAKVSFRLVPDQDPKEVFDIFLRKVKNINKNAVITLESSGEPFLMDYKSKYLEKAFKIMQEVFGKKPVFTREGGSIPATVSLSRELRVPVVLFGIGNHDCNLHSPKENLNEKNFYLGIEAIARYFEEISK